MKVKIVKKVLYSVVFLALVASFSSCNKGYGCPNNFKVEKAMIKTVLTAVKVIVQE